tara:strand:- start:17 stop:595 length:579 start_codon:yes stop_codon:yes gene_type:complete
MEKDKNILKSIITEMKGKATSSVTTFKINDQSQKALNWLLHTHHYNKKEMFEMLLSSKVFLSLAANKDNYISKITGKEIILKQRISPESLKTINEAAKEHKTSRNLLLINGLILLYENVSKSLNEDIQLIKKIKTKIEDLNKNINSISKLILKNEHTKETYHKYIDILKNENLKLKNILDEDIDNYKENSKK